MQKGMSKHDQESSGEIIQSQGGRARGEKLSTEKRKAIAAAAAAARWETPKASHGGIVKIGPWANIQCYNIEDDGEVKRLIFQEGRSAAT